MEKADQINPKYLDVSPITKGKRMLIYLADLFLNFIIAVTLFAAMVYPIARVIASSDDIDQDRNINEQQRIDILYSNDLLDYDENADTKYNINESLQYSANLYLLGFLNESFKPDYFNTFYVEYLGNDYQYLKDIIHKQDNYGFFNYEQDRLVLLAEYKEKFLPLLDSNDQLSNTAQADYDYFINSFFAHIYADLLNELLTSILITEASPLYEYRILDSENKRMTNDENMVAVYSTYVSYLLSSIIYFLIIPLISSHGKTIAMMAMRIERIGDNNFQVLSRKERIINFLYQLVFALPLIMFVPVMYIPITTIFSLPHLLYLSLISTGFVLISFVFIFINRLHRSLIDFLSRTILISKDILEQIYTIKGYMK